MTVALWFLMNAAIVLDWGQTRQIATERIPPYTWSNPDGSGGTLVNGQYRYEEINPILGKHPTTGQVNAFFIGSLVLNNAVMVVLPSNYRPWYAGTVLAFETALIVRNGTIGIGVNF